MRNILSMVLVLLVKAMCSVYLWMLILLVKTMNNVYGFVWIMTSGMVSDVSRVGLYVICSWVRLVILPMDDVYDVIDENMGVMSMYVWIYGL